MLRCSCLQSLQWHLETSPHLVAQLGQMQLVKNKHLVLQGGHEPDTHIHTIVVITLLPAGPARGHCTRHDGLQAACSAVLDKWSLQWDSLACAVCCALRLGDGFGGDPGLLSYGKF
jgi:hypothetical protein